MVSVSNNVSQISQFYFNEKGSLSSKVIKKIENLSLWLKNNLIEPIKKIFERIKLYFYSSSNHNYFTVHYNPIIQENPLRSLGQMTNIAYYPPKSYPSEQWSEEPCSLKVSSSENLSMLHMDRVKRFSFPRAPQTSINVCEITLGKIGHGIQEQIDVDVIVSAGNPEFTGGGGVAGVIARAMGARNLAVQSQKIRDMIQEKADHDDDKVIRGSSYIYYGKPGGMAVTSAGNLEQKGRNKAIFHVVAPNNQTSSLERQVLTEKEIHMALYSVYQNIFQALVDYNKEISNPIDKLKKIAIPALGTGIYNFPSEIAAKIALKAAQQFLDHYPEELTEIRFLLTNQSPAMDFNAYQNVLQKYFNLGTHSTTLK
jgi:O-acetyl-ADP-ribose deacetylase